MRDDLRRVVVTGLGLVTPLGCGSELVWRRLTSGQSGIRRLPTDLAPDSPSQVAGMAPTVADDPDGGCDIDCFILPKDQRRMDRFIMLALVAAEEALAQAHWSPETERQRERTATIVATALGGFATMMEAGAITATEGVRRLSPFTVPSFLANMAAGQISIRHGLRGPLGAPVTACAASLQAIGDAVRLIRAGEADVALAGGSEAGITRVSLGAFAAAKALSTHFNDAPEQASRPFDRDRDGFVMGEGAGIVALESLHHARGRGAVPLAEVLGYGTTADAHHVTAAPANGEGAQRAMRLALAQAELGPEAIGYLNAHATSTPLGDVSELHAIRAVFGEAPVAISSTKSATGHLCGAAGVVETIFSILALRDGLLPPTLNLEHPDEAAAGLDLIGPRAQERPVHYALSNGFGFGGVNASLVMGRAV